MRDLGLTFLDTLLNGGPYAPPTPFTFLEDVSLHPRVPPAYSEERERVARDAFSECVTQHGVTGMRTLQIPDDFASTYAG